jgi:hypothetical protein
MVLLSVAAVGAYAVGPDARPDVWTAFAILLCVGVALTFLERIAISIRALP